MKWYITQAFDSSKMNNFLNVNTELVSFVLAWLGLESLFISDSRVLDNI